MNKCNNIFQSMFTNNKIKTKQMINNNNKVMKQFIFKQIIIKHLLQILLKNFNKYFII